MHSKVLVAPLNWGLGHATRCIPVIRSLLMLGHEVVIAGDGDGLALLQKEFPSLHCVELPAWGVTYPSKGSFGWHMLKQAPKLAWAIWRERREVERWVRKLGISLIISDNRLGARSKHIPSVIMSHQLKLKAPFLSAFLNGYNHRQLAKFTEVWAVDVNRGDKLAGDLSTPYKEGLPVHYMGLLSRFTSGEAPGSTFDVLAIVSGPEPQRTLFEEEVRDKLYQSGLHAVLLRGKPSESADVVTQGNLRIYNHCSSAFLQELLAGAHWIISRTGYTTVMDLMVLQKKALLVPTPGQTEQEYLADRFSALGWYRIQRQGQLDISFLGQTEANCTIPPPEDPTSLDQFLFKRLKVLLEA